MKSIKSFFDKKIDFKCAGNLLGGGSDTWNECAEDTYSGRACDEYHQVTDDDGKHILSFTKEIECPQT